MTSRSLIQRAGVVLALVVFSAYLFYIGKGHTLLVDTNALTIDGKELRSAESVTVSIDGKELDPMGRAERVMISVGGPKHTILIVDDADGTKKVKKEFTIPTFMDMALVSVPAILGNASTEHWVGKFTPPPVEDTPAEKMQHEDDLNAQKPEGQAPEGQAEDTPKQ